MNISLKWGQVRGEGEAAQRISPKRVKFSQTATQKRNWKITSLNKERDMQETHGPKLNQATKMNFYMKTVFLTLMLDTCSFEEHKDKDIRTQKRKCNWSIMPM